MTFEKVDGIPKGGSHVAKCEKKSLIHYLDIFMKMEVKYARIRFGYDEYSNIRSAFESIRASIKRHNYPIKIYRRNGQIYLERTDISDTPKRKRTRKKVG